MSEAQPNTVAEKPKQRTAYFDNARFLLILLVVIGHALAKVKTNTDSAQTLYVFIYAFHMPAFVLITGYLSRRFKWDQMGVRRTLTTLVAPVVLFEITSQLVLKCYVGERFDAINPFVTQWLGWFLWAMVAWRILTPVLLSLRWPLAWAIGVSVLAPLYDWPNLLAADKVLGFLPFYIAGVLLQEKHFKWLAQVRVRAAAGLILLASLAVASQFPRDVSTTVLLWKRSYDSPALDTLTSYAMADRALLMFVGFVLTAAFLSLVSWSSTFFTLLGQRTLYCYLLHGFVLILAFETFNVSSHLPNNVVGTGVLVLGATALALALLSSPVMRLFKPVLEPSLSWILKLEKGKS